MAWGDTGVDWSSQDKLRGETWRPLHEIYAAIRERYEVVSAAFLATFPTDMIGNGKTKRNESDSPYRFDLHEMFDNLVTYFGWGWANQQTAIGVYTGLAEIPAWTIADLETAIGFSRPEDPEVKRGDKYTSSWIWWHYNAINLLVWSVRAMGLVEPYYRIGTSWPASSWVSGFGSSIFSNEISGNYGFSTYTRQAAKWQVTKEVTTLKSEIDFYMFTYNPYFWNDEGLGYVEDAVNLVDSTVASATQVITSVELGRIETAPVTGPNYTGWGVETDPDSKAVLKWNVVDGFDYV